MLKDIWFYVLIGMGIIWLLASPGEGAEIMNHLKGILDVVLRVLKI